MSRRGIQWEILMVTVCMKRVTIICDGALEQSIEREIQESGARSYTCAQVHGMGETGARPDRWHGPNVKVEIITSAELANRILERVSRKCSERYSVLALLDDVEVLRGKKSDAGSR